MYTLVDQQFGYVRFTARRYGIATEFFWGDHYSALCHIYARERHCGLYTLGSAMHF